MSTQVIDFNNVDSVVFNGNEVETLILNGVEIWKGFLKLDQLIDRSIESVSAEDLEGVDKIRNYAFYEAKNLKSVQLPDTCISVGDHAFEYCTSLEEVDVGNRVYYLKEYAFADCSNLKTINLGNVTDLSTRTFANCTSLTNIELPEGITRLGNNTFENCTGLIYIEVPTTVTFFDAAAFNGCTNLKTIRFLSTTPYITFGTSENVPESVTRIEVPSESLNAYQEQAKNTKYTHLMVGV